MFTSLEFEQELRQALTHLYDPDFQPSEMLYALTGQHAQDGGLGVQSAIIRMIEETEPPSENPIGTRPRLIYELLYSRFVLKLTQVETAECLHLSTASAWRLQREAVHMLAMRLWERNVVSRRSAGIEALGGLGVSSTGGEQYRFQAPDWRSQTAQEVPFLRASAPDAVADVGAAIRDVLHLGGALAPGDDVNVELQSIQPDLFAAVHPAVLRQVLIAAIGRLARHNSSAPIRISAGLEEGNTKITVTSAVAAEHNLTDEDLLPHGILAVEEVSIETRIEAGHAIVGIEFRSVDRVTVLVADDDLDTAEFDRRSTEGTDHHITREPKGRARRPRYFRR